MARLTDLPVGVAVGKGIATLIAHRLAGLLGFGVCTDRLHCMNLRARE